MSWLGNGFREEAKSLADAYASMYEAAEESEVIEEGSYDKSGHMNPSVKAKPSSDPDSNLNKGTTHPKGDAQKNKMEEMELLAALQDAYSMMYEKKKDSDKCGEGTYWDSEDKKCKKKKSSKNTTVVVGRGGIYGPGYHGGGSSGGGDTDGGDTDGGTDGGGDGGGGGGE